MKVDALLHSDRGRRALEQLCKPEALSADTAVRLVEAVQAQTGRARRRGLFDQIDQLLSADEA